MINVLIVDDEGRKRNRIIEVLTSALGEGQLEHSQAASASSAATLLEQFEFDLLVLDINLPMQDDSEPQPDGGMRLLRNLVRGGPRLRRPQHIVGLTAYDELRKSFESEFDSESWQLLMFESDSTAWEDVLTKRAVYISGFVDQGRSHETYETDIAIVTALKTIELEAVLNLPADWEPMRYPGDDTFYYLGRFERSNHILSVVAAAAIEMGMSAAACITNKVVSRFRPRYLAMAGIAAGVEANFGDIIFADQSWDYGSGKIYSDEATQSDFRPAPNYISVDAELKEKAQFFAQQRRPVINQISESWAGETRHTGLKVRIGPMASGAAVVESAEAIESIRAVNRKVIAVEMETYGVYLAGRTAAAPRPKCFSAKSVCDFGKPPKMDSYQRYAAYTSANFIYEFALDQLV